MNDMTDVVPPDARITNRADLIQALTVASQLEHGLMLMYLYAAFSMKSFPQELSPKESAEVLRDRLRNWESRILRVARQEMEHLGFVCNLLSAIGGNQYFDRPNFPQVPQYWPVDLPIELERFGVGALLRFLAYEKPENLKDPEVDQLRRLHEAQFGPMVRSSVQPIEPKFESLGELYMQIRSAFEYLPEAQLFLVPPSAQVDNDTLFGAGSLQMPVYNMYIFKTYDRQSAVNAINEIIEQGEGTLANGPITVQDMDPTCHYMLFRSVLVDYLGGLTQPIPLFDGARKCVRNPAWELHQDTISRTVFKGVGKQSALSVAIITHPWTRDLMGVSNTAYESLMQLLVRLYTFSGDNSAEVQGIVHTVFFPMMTMVIRPLSELMSLLPAFLPSEEKGFEPGYTAGAGFEYFRTIGFLPHKPAAWITIHERLSENATHFAEAIQVMPPDVRKALVDSGYAPDTALPFIRDNLFRIASNFKLYMNI
jgi:hypothetical protein